LDVVEGGDVFGVDTWTEEEVKDAFLKDGSSDDWLD